MISQDDLDAAFETSATINYPEDCARICAVAHGMGLHLTLDRAQVIWEWWSATMAAGWLHIRDDEEIQEAIKAFAARD